MTGMCVNSDVREHDDIYIVYMSLVVRIYWKHLSGFGSKQFVVIIF